MTMRTVASRPAHRRGWTLAEITVAAFLLMTVMALFAQILLPSLWLYRRQSASSEGQQAAWVFLHRMHEGLLNTMADSVTLGTSPPSIAFQPLTRTGAPYDATTGKPLFADYVEIFCYDAYRHTIWQKNRRPAGYDFSDNTRPVQVSTSDLTVLCASSEEADRVVATHVKELAFGTPGSSVLTFPLPVKIVCAVMVNRSGHEEEETWDVSTSVSCRNVAW